MIRGTDLNISLHPPRMVIYPYLPRKFYSKYTILGALWSWHVVDAVCAAVRVV